MSAPGTDDGTDAAYPAISLLKQQGNAAFQAKDWASAIDKYTEGLRLSYESGCEDHAHTLLSNRVAALLGDTPHTEARLKDAYIDAQRLCKMARNWSKTFYRLGQVLEALHEFMPREERPQETPWVEAYKNAWRRSAGPDRAIEAALKRCGVERREDRAF